MMRAPSAISILVGSIVLASGCATGGSGGPPGASAAASATRPFGGAPAAIPGKVEAEHFDEGPEGVACRDLDPENQGAPYRSTSADVEARPDASNGHGIGWTRGGEWLIYTVAVASTDRYRVLIPVASAGKGGTFHLEVDGKNVTGPINTPDTGSWQKLQVLTVPGVQLTAGVRTLRLSLDTDGETKSVADIDYFLFEKE